LIFDRFLPPDLPAVFDSSTPIPHHRLRRQTAEQTVINHAGKALQALPRITSKISREWLCAFDSDEFSDKLGITT
jgi:hypothetical protein